MTHQANGAMVPPLVQAAHLTRRFRVQGGLFRAAATVHAVEDVSFCIAPGETLGLVGESGCGKSTLGRTLLRLIEPTGGTIHLEGQNLMGLTQRQLAPLRRRMQLIFQDPYSALDPRMTIREILAEPLRIHCLCRPNEERERSAELLAQVGMKSESLDRYPHEFSGGQRQRIVTARALALDPRFIVCDEPLSALDVSIQAQIVNLFLDLRDSRNIGYLFISHDLEVVRFLSHRIAVMYLGRIIEMGPTEAVATNRLHPYTQALLGASPVADPTAQPRQRQLLSGDIPSPLDPPSGCAFHPRCPRAKKGLCDEQRPELTPQGRNALHQVACHIPEG